MLRKLEAELLPLDTELERTLRNMRKVKSVESVTMVDQRERMQPIPAEAETKIPQRKMKMEDFWRLVF